MNDKEYKIVNIGLVERPDPPIRQFFDEQELQRLVSSIRENGILVPLMVRPKGDKFEVIDGDRRLNAAWEADLREVPVVVYPLDDQQTHIQRMLANLDRDDTDPVSEAKYVARLIHEKIFTPEEYAEKIGRSLNWIEDRLTIAEMPEYMQFALANKQVSLGVCLQLVQIEDEGTVERYFREAMRSGMTVKAAELVRLQINEAILSLRESGQEVTEEALPASPPIPKVRCALTNDLIPITASRMIRVGIEAYEKWLEVRGIENGQNTLPYDG